MEKLTAPVPHAAAEDVARRSYGKLVAYLAAGTHDLAAAEDALSEAFASALIDWPLHGCPANPEAWLLTVARRKIIDSFRSRQRHEGVASDLDCLIAPSQESVVPDRRLALLFACAHPAIDAEMRLGPLET